MCTRQVIWLDLHPLVQISTNQLCVAHQSACSLLQLSITIGNTATQGLTLVSSLLVYTSIHQYTLAVCPLQYSIDYLAPNSAEMWGRHWLYGSSVTVEQRRLPVCVMISSSGGCQCRRPQSSSMGSTEQRKVVAGRFYFLSHVHMLHAAPLTEASAAPLPEPKLRPPTGFVAPGRSPGAGSTAKDNHSNCRQLVIKCHQILRMSSNVFYECTWPPQCIHNRFDSSKSALEGRGIETRSLPIAPCITTE